MRPPEALPSRGESPLSPRPASSTLRDTEGVPRGCICTKDPVCATPAPATVSSRVEPTSQLTECGPWSGGPCDTHTREPWGLAPASGTKAQPSVKEECRCTEEDEVTRKRSRSFCS